MIHAFAVGAIWKTLVTMSLGARLRHPRRCAACFLASHGRRGCEESRVGERVPSQLATPHRKRPVARNREPNTRAVFLSPMLLCNEQPRKAYSRRQDGDDLLSFQGPQIDRLNGCEPCWSFRLVVGEIFRRNDLCAAKRYASLILLYSEARRGASSFFRNN